MLAGSASLRRVDEPFESLMTPRTEEEWLYLEELLDEAGSLDMNGALGVCHAVAVGPSVLKPATWIDLLFPDDAFDDHVDAQAAVALAVRLCNEVVAAVHRRKPITPPADDLEGCASFAKGFMAVVVADPEWGDKDDRYAKVGWGAVLALDPSLDPTVERMPSEEERAALRPQLRQALAALVMETHDTFLPLRVAAGTRMRAGRVGRNDACPCGSGKKYKKCCGGEAVGRTARVPLGSREASSAYVAQPRLELGAVGLFRQDAGLSRSLEAREERVDPRSPCFDDPLLRHLHVPSHVKNFASMSACSIASSSARCVWGWLD